MLQKRIFCLQSQVDAKPDLPLKTQSLKDLREAPPTHIVKFQPDVGPASPDEARGMQVECPDEASGMQMEVKSLRSNASASDIGSHTPESFERDVEIQTEYPDVDQECQANLIPLGENVATYEDSKYAEAVEKQKMQWACESSTQTSYPLEPNSRGTQIWQYHKTVRLQTKDAFFATSSVDFFFARNSEKTMDAAKSKLRQ